MSRVLLLVPIVLQLLACGSPSVRTASVAPQEPAADNYVVGAGDRLEVFVWGHEDLSTVVSVRPDGNISTPLVEDMLAAGRTPTQLARAIEERLSEFVRSPTVTIIVQQFVGEYNQQVRVVGQAAEPTSLNFRAGMTLLDVMIEVGGLSEFAAGNRAKVIRRDGAEETVIDVRINDLLNRGDMRQNLRMKPGDVLIIPESVF